MVISAEVGVGIARELIAKDSWFKKVLSKTAPWYKDIYAGGFNFPEIAEKANRLQAEIIERLPAAEAGFRRVDTSRLVQLAELLADDGGLIIMRHGIQFLDEETKNLDDPFKKIRLMQDPHNLEDPLEAQSLAESSAFGFL